jgi:Fe-Mn family superoxide dismutase
MKTLNYVLIGIMAMATISCTASNAKNGDKNKENITNTKNMETMKFEKVALSYELDALAPVIGKQTMELHYGKHYQAYIDNLNKLIVGTKFENADLETIVKESDGGIFNNAGQALNHQLYFTSFSGNGGGEPQGKLAEAINSKFGSFEKFKEEFVAAGLAVFGSGWVFLAKDDNGNLSIEKESNAGNPITRGLTTILPLDVWEHSYYLDYQNRRADHLKEVWKVLDWKVISDRY